MDVVLFDKTSKTPSEAPIVGLIEVKKYGQRWACEGDRARLLGLGAELEVKSAMIVAHLQYDNEKRLQCEFETLVGDCKVRTENACIQRFQSGTEYCASVVVAAI